MSIRAVLAEAGAASEHIGRMTWYLIDKREYIARGCELGQACREVLGRDYGIAMSAVQVAALMEGGRRSRSRSWPWCRSNAP